jgi:hypothetical protein
MKLVHSNALRLPFVLPMIVSVCITSLAQNIDTVKVRDEDSVPAQKLALFAEQYRNHLIYYPCVTFRGIEKDKGVFCLAVTTYDGSRVGAYLKREGITFVVSPKIASTLIDMRWETQDCNMTLGFKIEQMSEYWIAKVFEVGVHGSNYQTKSVLSEAPNISVLSAGKRGDKYAVEALLQWSNNVNTTDENGKTALMYAAENGHSKTVKTLLEKGADLTIKSKNGKTALMHAREAGMKDIAKVLEKAGAKE